MKQIVFQIGDHFFRANLNGKAPRICRKLVECLPLRTFAVHAKFAGEEIITMVPFLEEPENEILQVKAGDIGYYPGRQTLCLFYGEVAPFGPVSVFASLVPPLDAVRTAAKEILKQGFRPVTIQPEETGDVSKADREPVTPKLDPEVPLFVKEYWRQAWEAMPLDVKRLLDMRRPPMGNMPCVFYACKDLFWLGEELQVLRKMALKHAQDAISLKNLWQTAGALVQHHAMRIEKWGMVDTVSFLRRLAEFVSNGAGDVRTTMPVIEASWIALNRVQSWTDLVIPWNGLDDRLGSAIIRPS